MAWRLIALGLATSGALRATAAGPAVYELRQYKIVAGQRDAFIRLFDEAFVDPQEAVGIRVFGQFRDLDDANRFVWLRGFADMDARGKALNDFYFGPVWQARRGEANPLLDDNDNVLLLRDAGHAPEVAVAPPTGTAGGVVFATIYYLWKEPTEGFAAFFEAQLQPALARAGLPVVASFVPERSPNNFPRLPIRTGERVFVWFTRADQPASHEAALQRLQALPEWPAINNRLKDELERSPQVLRLDPSPRSRIR